MLTTSRVIVDAIQKAADKAAEKGVEVKVDIRERGMMGDSIEVVVTATPKKPVHRPQPVDAARPIEVVVTATPKKPEVR